MITGMIGILEMTFGELPRCGARSAPARMADGRRPRARQMRALTRLPSPSVPALRAPRGGNFPTIFQNYTINNVHCAHVSGTALYVDGLTEMPIRDVVMRNVRVDQAKKATDFKNAVGFEFTGVEVNNKPVSAPPSAAAVATSLAGCRPAMGMK